MRSSARLVLTVVLFGAASRAPLAAQTVSSQASARCWSAAATSEIYAGESCVAIWADSLRSTLPANSSRARDALRLTGGRAAVDALRADYERAPSRASRFAVILAMGTTGSPDDVAFLTTQLQGPFIGDSEIWFGIATAATTLGLLRATAARDSLQAALTRNNNRPGTFAGHAVATALASLDRPPCADSVVGNVERELIRIVMQCGPQSMWTSRRYNDSSAGGVWSFERDSWRFAAGAPVDTTMPRVTATATIASDGRHADVEVSTWCGSLCGEGWSFRLILTGKVWRVVTAVMNWVS